MIVTKGGACSACYNASDHRHVDMNAAFDGPVLSNGMVIDDLILCEPCVKNAVDALDLNESANVVALAESRVREAEAEAEKWKRYAKSLEMTQELRPVELPEVKKTGKKVAA